MTELTWEGGEGRPHQVVGLKLAEIRPRLLQTVVGEVEAYICLPIGRVITFHR